MPEATNSKELALQLDRRPRASLAQLPTPLHQLKNFSLQFDDQEIWVKRDDLTGLEGGGNKTRKLEYLVGDAVNAGADRFEAVPTVSNISVSAGQALVSDVAYCGAAYQTTAF